MKAARNQSLFREVNDQIAGLNETFEQFAPTGDWVCECAESTCMETISMTLTEYEALRADGNRFAVRPGHERADVEEVVEANERYLVVSKLGSGADEARRLDQRASGS